MGKCISTLDDEIVKNSTEFVADTVASPRNENNAKFRIKKKLSAMVAHIINDESMKNPTEFVADPVADPRKEDNSAPSPHTEEIKRCVSLLDSLDNKLEYDIALFQAVEREDFNFAKILLEACNANPTFYMSDYVEVAVTLFVSNMTLVERNQRKISSAIQTAFSLTSISIPQFTQLSTVNNKVLVSFTFQAPQAEADTKIRALTPSERIALSSEAMDGLGVIVTEVHDPYKTSGSFAGQSALVEAIRTHQNEFVELLLSYPCDINRYFGGDCIFYAPRVTPLMVAILCGNHKAVKMLKYHDDIDLSIGSLSKIVQEKMTRLKREIFILNSQMDFGPKKKKARAELEMLQYSNLYDFRSHSRNRVM